MIETLDELDRPSACGLAALILIAQREQTSVAYQYEEWNFSDIPRYIIDDIDLFDDTFQLAIAQRIMVRLNKDEALPDGVQPNARYFTNLLPLKTP